MLAEARVGIALISTVGLRQNEDRINTTFFWPPPSELP
jgi:hypothetical protein